MRIIGETSVAVPVKMPRAVVAPVPHAHRVVAQHDDLCAAIDLHRHLVQVVDGSEERCKLPPCRAISEARIVIADHEDHVPASNPGSVCRRVAGSEAEVAKMVKPVIGRDSGVAAVDDRRVHFLNSRKRPLAVLDDVRVPEVRVCGKEDRHGGFLALCKLAAARGVP